MSRPPGRDPAPWPFAEGDPPDVRGAHRDRIDRQGGEAEEPGAANGSGFCGAAGSFPIRIAAASPHHWSAAEKDRAGRLVEARDALAATLALLDLHSRSPAAANVDLAIHYLNLELGG